MATAGPVHRIEGIVEPTRDAVEPTIAPGRRTLVGDEVGAQTSPASAAPKLRNPEAELLARDLGSALAAVREVRTLHESRCASDASPAAWRIAIFVASAGPMLSEVAIGAKLAGLDDAAMEGPGMAAVMSTDTMLEAFLDDLRQRVDGLLVAAAVVARTGADARAVVQPVVAAIRARFEAIGGNTAVAAFTARATTVIARAEVTPGPVTRAIEIGSETTFGVSPPGLDANQFYGGVAIGAAKGVAAAVVDTFRGIEIAGELTSAMITTLFSGHAVDTILSAAQELAEAVNNHPLDRLGVAFAMQWMAASSLGRGEICGKVVGYLAALVALAAVSGGATVEAELAYGIGELGDLVRAALRISDPLAALNPIGQDAARATWAETVRVLELRRNPKVWKLACEYLGAIEWSPTQVESLSAGVRAVERGDTHAAAVRFEQLVQSGMRREDVEAFESELTKSEGVTKLVTPSLPPSDTAVPRGTRTVRNPADQAQSSIKAYASENETADVLAKNGYDIEQNPSVEGTKKNPDYRIEGKIFDNYAPTSAKPRSIWTAVEEKIEKEQTRRVVINLDSSRVDLVALKQQFADWPIKNLEQILIVKGDTVMDLLP